MKLIDASKLEALPLYNDRQWIKYSDLRALIEAAPESSEPVAVVGNAVAQHTRTGKFNTINTCLPAGTKLYTTPQDQPQLILELAYALENQRDNVTTHYVTETYLDELLTRAEECKKQQLKNTRKQITEYGVWHPDDGLIYTSPSRDLCNSHINEALMDEPLDAYAKAFRVVEVTYFHPTKMHSEK